MLYRHCFSDLLQSLLSIQVNQYGLKLNVTHQILVYADVNILGGSLYTVKKTLNLW